ncbi:MAG: DUF418 domain-containing protein [Cellvibrionaceae bacterium]|nr:DUF418 domain-containing protein [Cellvibrionaceae bacterium]
MSNSIRLSERISSIDTIRGFALLGLLTMNLVGMSMPMAAYLSPLAFRADEPLNDVIFSVFFIFADQKFMGMFSLLFGASILLLIERLQAKGEKTLGLHYRRNFVLLLIGLLHAAFLWEGDVLMIYGFCALLLYPLHKSSPWVLATIAFVLLAAAGYSAGGIDETMTHMDAEALANIKAYLQPTAEAIAELKQNYSGSFQEVLDFRLGLEEEDEAGTIEIDLIIVLSSFYRALGMMCLGMALYKWQYLQGKLALAIYKKVSIAGMAVGLPLALMAWYLGQSTSWSVESYFAYWGIMPLNILASVALVMAYVSVIILLCRYQWAMPFQKKVQALGQTALSNYLLQSLIGTTIMYGYGFGMWGELARWQLVLLMLAIWSLQLYLAPLWLRYFRQGPVEYIWRCLSYLSLPAIRR